MDEDQLHARVIAELADGADLNRGAQLPGIPSADEDVRSLSKTVRAMKTVVDTLTGSAGSVLDKAPTLRELILSGALNLTSTSLGGGVGSSTTTVITGSGGGSGGALGDSRPYILPPPTPTALAATGMYNSVFLTWSLSPYRNHAFNAVLRGTTNNPATAIEIGTAVDNQYIDTAATASVLYYYWVRAVGYDSSGASASGTLSTFAMGGRQMIGTSDLGPLIVEATNLKDGSISAAKLADLAIGATKFASGIEPVTIVTGLLPTTKSTSTIFWTDGKLYRWNGTAYTKVVDATDIAANSITAGQIKAGAIGADQIAAGAISTGKLLVTGQGSALNADPNTQDAASWVGGTLTTVVDATSPTGRALEITSTGATTAEAVRVPIDATRNYLLRIYARQVSGTSYSYLGVEFTDASGDIVHPVAGGWSSGSYDYFGLVSSAPPAAYTPYQISFGPDELAKAPVDAKYVRVIILGNYVGTGVQRFAGIRLTEKAAADLIVDGAIIATKLAAGSIAVGTLAVEDGAIRNALIANLAVDDAKILSMAVGKMTAGKLAIGQYIYSQNYSKNNAGWAINADGTAEFGATSIRGQLVASQIKAWGLSIWSADGTREIIKAGNALPISADVVDAAPGWLNSNVKVGGRNIMPGASTGTGWIGGAGTVIGAGEFLITRAAASGQEDYIYSPYVVIPAATEITISFETKQTGNVLSCEVFLLPNNNAVEGLVYSDIPLSSGWVRKTITQSTPVGWVSPVRFRFDHNGGNGSSSTLHVRRVKLEYGNKATDWTPPVEDVAEATAAAQLTASNAAIAASTAQGAANTANGLLADISSDSKLTPVELAPALLEWHKANNEYDGIRAGLTNSGTAEYIAAFTALSQYLNGSFTRGIPGCFSNMQATIGIDKSNWDNAWANYFYAKQILLNAIAAKAATTAGYAFLSGTPDAAIANSSMGFGANLCPNADFSDGLTGWEINWNPVGGVVGMGGAGADWVLNRGVGDSTNTLSISQDGADDGEQNLWTEVISQPIPVVGSGRYCVSAYTGAHRCSVDVFAYVYNAAGDNIQNIGPDVDRNREQNTGGINLDGYKRHQQIRIVDSAASYVRVALRKFDTMAGNTNSWAFITRVAFNEVGATATTAGPWSAPGVSNSSRASALTAAAAAVQARIDLDQIIGAAKLDGVITTTEQKAINEATNKATAAQNEAVRLSAIDSKAKADAAALTSTWDGTSGAGKPLTNAGIVVDLGSGTTVFGQRERNDMPWEYSTPGKYLQFKASYVIGLAGADYWATLETTKQYFNDGGGGRTTQYAYSGTGTWRRTSTSSDTGTSTWTAWVVDLDRNSYTGDLNATANQSDATTNNAIGVAATKATWGANIANTPTNLSQLVGSEGILNSALSQQIIDAAKTANWSDVTLKPAFGALATADNVGWTGVTGKPAFGTFSALSALTQANASTYIEAAAFGLVHINTATITNLAALSTYTGTLTVDSAGWIRGGQTDWATGSGFFLGMSGGTYKFSVGDASSYMRWSVGGGLELGTFKLPSFTAPLDYGAINYTAYTANRAFVGSRKVTPTGGTAPYTYAWALLIESANSGSIAVSNGDTATISVYGSFSAGGDASGRITCTVKDSNGLTASASFFVLVSSNA